MGQSASWRSHVLTFRNRGFPILTRKSSCVNARGVSPAAYQVLHLQSYPCGITPPLDQAGGTPSLAGLPSIWAWLGGTPSLDGAPHPWLGFPPYGPGCSTPSPSGPGQVAPPQV